MRKEPVETSQGPVPQPVHEALKARGRSALLGGGTRICEPCGQTCFGVNVQVPPTPEVVRSLVAVQEALRGRPEAGLWAIPEEALHLSVFNVVGATEDYGTYTGDKEALWREMEPGFVRGLQALGRQLAPYPVLLDDLAVTDAAVVALGSDGGRTSALREAIRAHCPIPAGTRYAPQIVHVTLFRFRAPLRDPAALLERVAAARMRVAVPVERLTLRKELVYPSLLSEPVEEVWLRGAGALGAPVP